MAGPARQRLDALNKRIQSSIASEKGSTSLPPDYSDYIKAAQAEEAASRKGAASSVPKPGNRPMNETSRGNSTASSAPRNVPKPQSAPPQNVPVPQSADDARTANEVDESGAGTKIIAILTAALGTAGAYALYKRLSKGDPDAMNEANTIMKEQGATDPATDGRSTAVAEAGPDPSRFGDDIVDADYDVLPDRQAIEQKDVVPTDPRSGMNDYIDVLDAETGMTPESSQGLLSSDLERSASPDAEDVAAQDAVERGNGPRPEVARDPDMDEIIRQAIEEGGAPSAKGGRVSRSVRAEVPRPKFKPRT